MPQSPGESSITAITMLKLFRSQGIDLGVGT